MNTTISPEALCSLEQKFDQNPVHTVAMNAVYTNGINACARNYPVDREITHDYSISLTQGKITNQKKSGRCWMFAALNCLRFALMKKCNLETFELSQSYTLFYDKLEKSNYFLESILNTLDEKTSSRPCWAARCPTAASGICFAAWSTNTVWFQNPQCQKATAPRLHRKCAPT